MKKCLLLFFSSSISLLPVVSCNEVVKDYKEMSWDVDNEKLKKIIDDNQWEAFNKETISEQKLLKIIKGDNNKIVDYYTQEALKNNWFEKFEFQQDENKIKVINLTIKLKKQINQKDCPFSLPNSQLEWIIEINQ